MIALLVSVAAVTAALVPLLHRDLARAESRRHMRAATQAAADGIRAGWARIERDDAWQRALVAYRIEQRVAMSVMRPTDAVKIIADVS